MPPKLQALLATARIANVPSVISNVLTGMLLMVFFSNNTPKWDQPTLFAITAGCCLYIAGNFLNDWYDLQWDRQNRPERALPLGMFPRILYLLIALILAGAGLILAAILSKTVLFVYVIIAILVVLYTLFHKKSIAAIWIMGACRAGLYVLGYAAMKAGLELPMAIFQMQDHYYQAIILASFSLPVFGMISYIAGITMLARYEKMKESLSGQTIIFSSMLLLLPALTHSCILVLTSIDPTLSFGDLCNPWTIAGIVPFLLWTTWTIFRKLTVTDKVHRLLAGIALVDSVYILCLCIIFSGMVNLTVFLCFPLLAFFASLLLQKIAPAT